MTSANVAHVKPLIGLRTTVIMLQAWDLNWPHLGFSLTLLGAVVLRYLLMLALASKHAIHCDFNKIASKKVVIKIKDVLC